MLSHGQKAFLGLIITLISSCSSKFPNQAIDGKKFISVRGKSLDQVEFKIPEDFVGSQTLLLLGYKQNSQFDIDRWLIGLDMRSANISVYEIPTIQGLFPRMFSTKIDAGMRKGIPKKLWKGVITVYQDGEKVQKFTGNTQPNNTRVILLDAQGNIVYFNDEGFSVEGLNNLLQKIKPTAALKEISRDEFPGTAAPQNLNPNLDSNSTTEWST